MDNLSSSNPADLIYALFPVTGRLGGNLFALGLFNAGWLAAIAISFSSAYSVAGAFGWKRSLNHRIAEAPQFYGLYFGALLVGFSIYLYSLLAKDLQEELARTEEAHDISELEKRFVKVARSYGHRKGISYGTWRAAGVSAAVLERAGVTRARA